MSVCSPLNYALLEKGVCIDSAKILILGQIVLPAPRRVKLRLSNIEHRATTN